MKFWVRINGLQEGPMEIDQMKDYNITPTTYVWCAGMKDWAYARDVEDLKDVIKTDEIKVIEETPAVEPASTEQPQQGTSTTETAEDTPTSESDDSAEEVATPQPEAQTEQQAEPAPVEQPQPQKQQQFQDERPCPPNNLVWAILATVFCCQITGIIAIVFAAQVSNKYYNEGYSAAKKYSDMAGLWCIISIVLAILSYSIFMPFMLLAPLL